MLTLIGSALLALSLVPLVSFTGEALAMYGLVALLIGLIAWSKFSEPAPSDPHPAKKSAGSLPDSSHPRDLGPAVAVPVVDVRTPERSQP